MELQSKVALVTGAGSGIGRAAALLMAREGAFVGALGHTADEIEDAVREIERAGWKAVALPADVSDSGEMKEAVSRLVQQFGRLDIVFANAGINGVWAPLEDLQPDEWDRTINTNLRGTYLTLHHAIPHLKTAGGGSIVITSSINGTRTFTSAGSTAYSCTKAAQVAMAQIQALELAKHKIRVNVICPGKIETAISASTEKRNTAEAEEAAGFPDGKIPLTDGEPGTSEEVADLVLFLASDRSRHITGTPIWIDGGQSLLV